MIYLAFVVAARLRRRALAPVALARACGRRRRAGLDLPDLHPRRAGCPAGDGASRRPGRASPPSSWSPIPTATSRTTRAGSTGRPAAFSCAFALAGIAVSGSVIAGDGRPVFVAAFVARSCWRRASASRRRRPAAACGGPDGRRSPPGLADPARDRRQRPKTSSTRAAMSSPSGPHALVGLSRPRSPGARRHRRRVAAAPRAQASICACPTAAWYAGAATVGPLLALVAAYWRVAALERSLSFALVAGVLALAFMAAMPLARPPGCSRRRAPCGSALGATASAALAALALGLTFALDKGMLTVAFALTALGTAWVAERVAIPALRYAVGAIGLLVLGTADLGPDHRRRRSRPGPDQLASLGLRRPGPGVSRRQPPAGADRPRLGRPADREPRHRLCRLPGLLRDPPCAAGGRSAGRDHRSPGNRARCDGKPRLRDRPDPPGPPPDRPGLSLGLADLQDPVSRALRRRSPAPRQPAAVG